MQLQSGPVEFDRAAFFMASARAVVLRVPARKGAARLETTNAHRLAA